MDRSFSYALLISLLLLIIAPGNEQSLSAQPGDDGHTLLEAIETAVENNPAVKAAESAWQASLKQVTASGSWPEPSLSVTYLARPVETRNGPQNQQIALNQMIPVWGTVGLRQDIAQRKAQKAEEEFRAARLKVITNVKSVWSDLYRIDASLSAMQEYRDLLETFREIAETRYSTGQGLQVSVLKSHLEISSLDEQILNFQDMRQTVAHQFNRLLNQSIATPVAQIDTLLLPEHTLSESALLDSLAHYRQDLQGLKSMIEANRSMVRMQHRQNLPMVGVGVNYITIGNTSLAAPDPGADALGVMANINIPLWFGANRARVQEARLQLAGVQYQYNDVRNNAESEVRSLHFKIRQTEKSLNLYETQIIPQASQSLQSALAAYRTGSLGFLDLLESERTILQFRLNYYTEQAEYFQQLANLEKAVGTELYPPDIIQ